MAAGGDTVGLARVHVRPSACAAARLSSSAGKHVHAQACLPGERVRETLG